MRYDVQYFINKFEAIPEDEWVVGALIRGHKLCANGHCGVRVYTEGTEESKAMFFIFKDMHLSSTDYGKPTWLESSPTSAVYGQYSDAAANINDGYSLEYQQKTPKQRILAALYDIRDNELSEANLMAVEKIVNDIQNIQYEGDLHK